MAFEKLLPGLLRPCGSSVVDIGIEVDVVDIFADEQEREETQDDNLGGDDPGEKGLGLILFLGEVDKIFFLALAGVGEVWVGLGVVRAHDC